MTTNPERALIASILLAPSDSFQTLDRLAIQPADLIQLETREMLQELLRMRDEGQPIDQAVLSSRLPQRYQAAAWEVTSEIAAPAAEHWAALVVKVGKRSRLIELADTLRQTAGNPESDVEQAIDTALLTLSKTQDKGLISKSETLREAASRVIDDLDNAPRFIPTPWPALNEVIGGLRPGAFYVIAARPGVGKTLLGLQLAQGIASPERPAAFFSFEMTGSELATRALSSKTGINIGAIDRRTISEKDKEALALAYRDLSQSLHLIATPSREVTQLRPALRAIKSNSGGKLGAVVIDYLGLMEAKGSSIYEKVTAISGQLKSLAMELDIPIIALAQLNRKAEERPGAPSLADLRDSGAIEQDADAVLMLHSDEQGSLVITVQKNRQGPQGYLMGKLDKATMTLKDLVKVS